MTFPPTFARTIQQSQEWLKDLVVDMSLANEQEAYSVLRAVLHQLRDRLTVEEATDLGAQLPTLIRGIYYESYNPARTPQKLKSVEEFLDGVDAQLNPPHTSADNACQHVFALLNRKISEGEIRDVQQMLPDDVKSLWPAVQNRNA